MSIEAVIFDLDGVIVSTDDLHYQAWQKLADQEGIPFDRTVNERLRGVSRMASLEILLERSSRAYTASQKGSLADRKNERYRQMLEHLTPGDILPGAMEFMRKLRKRAVKLAVASSSRNAGAILKRIGLGDFFDATADGNDISRSKPDPEVFLLAASRLNVQPRHCVVVEDALAGVEAALAGGMKVLAVGYASKDSRANLRAKSLAKVSIKEVLALTPC